MYNTIAICVEEEADQINGMKIALKMFKRVQYTAQVWEADIFEM